MTVLDLIKGSMRLVKGLGVGRGIDGAGSIAADCLFHLNSMVQSWTLERCVIYQITELTNAVSGAPSRVSLATRPIKIEAARWKFSDGPHKDLEVCDYAQWLRRTAGFIQRPGATPDFVWYDNAVTGGYLYLSPVPSDAGTLITSIWSALSSFAATSDVIALPPGYERAIMYGLACEIAAIFPDTSIDQYVIDQAVESKAAIKRLNLPSPILDCDPALLGRRDFFSF